jgi:hypothetical protein
VYGYIKPRNPALRTFSNARIQGKTAFSSSKDSIGHAFVFQRISRKNRETLHIRRATNGNILAVSVLAFQDYRFGAP